MSGTDRMRLKVIAMVDGGLMKQREASEQIQVCERQVRRLLVRYRKDGDGGILHRGRGRRSHRRIAESVENEARGLLRTIYHDFGPTLAAEMLDERDGIVVSRETVRKWMRAEGLFARRRRERPHRHRRARRPCFGELVQVDTSEHAWIEDRGPKWMLITLIDDATGRKMARFFETDSTATNMAMFKMWFQTHGLPLAFYTDRASHFRQVSVAGEKPKQTQIERALEQLGVRLICAHSPQAKGRVERSHGTDQDRLIKMLRLEGIGTIEGANAYLEKEYLRRTNKRFAVEAAMATDVHGEPSGLDLEAILSVHEKRTVARDYTIALDGTAWQIERQENLGGLVGARVTMEKRLDGSLSMRWGERYLTFRRAAQTRLEAQAFDGEEKTKRLEKKEEEQNGGNDAGQGDRFMPGGSSGLRPSSPPEKKTKKAYKPAPDHPWKTGHF